MKEFKFKLLGSNVVHHIFEDKQSRAFSTIKRMYPNAIIQWID